MDRFVYLGAKLNSGGGCALAIINRCGIAWGKFRQLLPILTSKYIALTTVEYTMPVFGLQFCMAVILGLL